MAPQVSVIIPVYNSAAYVGEAIQSVLDQTIDPEQVEILAVDDGSTDDSPAILAAFAAEDSRITVITQENSGTPGGGRNPAIGRATGDFIFFLDSDDRLTSDALRRMVEVAVSEGSDVVLGKLASSDKRHAPVSMFGRSVMDAHLVEDKVFNTLGPTKLIRRSIIEGLGLRFPTDQSVGEDQPFMAAVYLTAKKISVLADQDYYIIRHREDGTNQTLTKRTSESHLETALRLAEAIEKHSEPGELRDALLKRPFAWSMKRSLDGRWLQLEREEQSRLAEEFRRRAGHLYSDAVRARLPIDQRIALDLLVADELEGLHAYVDHLYSGTTGKIIVREGRFQRQLPEGVARLLPDDDLTVAPPRMACRLEDVQVRGTSVDVSATVRIPDLVGAPDELVLRARKRGTQELVDLRTTSSDLSAGARSFAIAAEAVDLGRGVWDLFVLVRLADLEKEIRLGSERSRTIAPEGTSNVGESPAPQDRLVAYFTQGPGNLSLDRGGVLHKKLAVARVLGLDVDADGRGVVLVETSSPPGPGDEYFAEISGIPQTGGRHLLPATRLGERLLSLRLPLSARMVGATVVLSSVNAGVRSRLPVPSADFWPARAAGFGLCLDEDGSMHVTEPAESPRGQRSGSSVTAGATRLRQARTRVTSLASGVPVAGPFLQRAVGALRNRRR